ncbi:NAD-dependent epimerase/dehydratase family protein [soil metagenome]
MNEVEAAGEVVAVTGSNGFIGRVVSNALRDGGHSVIGLVRGVPSDGEIADDLSDANRLADLFRSHKVATVCHFAWSGHPRTASLDHAGEIHSNIDSTLNLLVACGLAHVSHVVFLSSGGGRRIATIHGAPAPPYGWAKSVASAAVLVTAEAFGYSATVLRPTAVYGPGQDPAKKLGAVSVFADRLLRGESLQVIGSQEVRRDFLHVDDLSQLVLACVAQRTHGEYDVGGPELLSLTDVIEALESVAGLTPVIEVANSTGVDPEFVRLDNSSVSAATGWSPQRLLRDSLPEMLIANINQSGLEARHAALLEQLKGNVR